MRIERFFPILLLLFIVSCSSDIKEDDKLPNIVIVFTDDQGYGDVGCLVLRDLKHLILTKWLARA